MKPTKFERNNHTIKELPAGERKVFESINAAKRESWKHQMGVDGALGRGTLKLA